jgi:hypothetical protein
MKVRAGLVTAVYQKALALSNDERGGRASGDIVNLMSVDASRLQDLCTYGLIVISGPLQVNPRKQIALFIQDVHCLVFVCDRLLWLLCRCTTYLGGLVSSVWPS